MNRRLIISTLIASVALPLVAATSSPSRTPAAKPAKPQHVSMGAPVKLTDYLVPGKTVVFDFYSDYCGPCKAIAPALEALHAKRDDIIVVKIDINRPEVKGIDWKSPVAKQYGLNSIPHLKIYGPDGKLMAEDGENGPKARQLVMGWLEKT